jgi:RNA polymerase sigma-70 factor (ECF subfamily)
MTKLSLEEPLLPRIAAGERDAVDACIERYSRLVWSLARGLSRDPNEVEDVVQEIFIDVWKSAARFDPRKASETTFVATIARRRVIDRRRRTSRQPEVEAVEDDSEVVEDRALDVLGEREEAEQALSVVESLDPPRRKVLLMAIVEGLTHTQIAGKTGLPLGTVKSHARRGLLEVAERLRARHTPGGEARP